MNRKLKKQLTPVIAVGVALLAGLGMYLIMDVRHRPSPTPGTTERNDTASPERPRPERPERTEPERTRPDDNYRPPSEAGPDTVNRDRPPRPFEAPEDLRRLMVEGRVLTSQGAPVEDAEVTFSGEHGLRGVTGTGFTDATGHYRVLAYSARGGRSASTDRGGSVVVRAPDGGVGDAQVREIPEGPVAMIPDITIERGGTIEGIVETPDGRAAPGAQVVLRSARPMRTLDERRRDGRVSNRPLSRVAYTDDRGMFRVSDLPAARYRVTISEGFEGTNTNAEDLTLGGGETAFVQIKLRAENYIRGRVVDQTGSPVPGVTVALLNPDRTDADGDRPVIESMDPSEARLTRREAIDGLARFEESGLRHRTQTDSQGRYAFFGLQDNNWTVVATLNESDAEAPGTRINGPDTDLVLQSTSAVTGRVIDADTGRPVTAFDVRIFGAAVDERDADPFARVARDRPYPYRADGHYRLATPELSKFTVRVTAPGYAIGVATVDSFRPGEVRGGVDILLKPLCRVRLTARHDGRLLDLEPVMLLFEDRLVHQSSTDEVGRALIPEVTPGKYQVRLIQADGTLLRGEVTVPVARRAELEVELTAP
jgi:hypothetical protein